MSNFKNELNNWQQVPRELVFDKTITDRARFVYVYMACKPDDWVFHTSAMSKDLGYSEETTRKYIKELISKGWLSKEEQSRVKGVFGNVIYTLHATQKSPCTEKAESDKNRVGKNSSLYNRELKHNSDNVDKDSININETSLDSTPLPPKQPKQKKQSYNAREDMSYVDAKFTKLWLYWLDYKDEIKKPYKTTLGAKSEYDKWINLSDNNIVLAHAIVMRSIESSWSGLFQFQSEKQKDYYMSSKSPYASTLIDFTDDNVLPTEETPTTNASVFNWQG